MEFLRLTFLDELEENLSTRSKPLGAKERTNNKLNPHNFHGVDIQILVGSEDSHHCSTLDPPTYLKAFSRPYLA